ncbi:MAG: M28 family metallopeptidase [Acidobacteriota bacterium]
MVQKPTLFQRLVGLPAAVLLLLPAAACGNSRDTPIVHADTAGDVAASSIKESEMARWIKDLAADRMQGRLPGTQGEERATAYIADAFKAAGLKPAAGESYFQPVPLVGITADDSMAMMIKGGRNEGEEQPRGLVYGKEFMAVTAREQEKVSSSGELVFAGYGTVAPEFGWDDYKGTDVKGKVLVMLVNDPPLPDASRFGGKRMTYYGRWTYKYDIGAAKGAAGVILVHETKAAGYPWGVVSGSWSGEQFVPQRDDHGKSRLPFESWITVDTAREIFRRAGLDLDKMKAAAASDEFHPVPMGLTASLTITNKIRRIESKNVAGLLPGGDLSNQWIIFTAHWDHLGVGPPVDGDNIYNGAFDNATGIASLIGLAHAFSALLEPPRRSILFLAVTAEEQGLIGSYHYADHPLHPLAETAALINMDGMNVLGRTRDIIVIGLGKTTLDDLITRVATQQGRQVTADMEPEKGFYYRSDQFPFAKKGVPALYTDHGIDYIGKPDGWGMQQNNDYTLRRYHKPSDEFDPDWNLSGMEEDTRLLFRVGYLAAQADRMQQWKEGAEFKAAREKSLAQAGSR